MNIQRVHLKSGLVIGNFNIPTELIFTSGEVLEACPYSWAARFTVKRCQKSYYCRNWHDLWPDYQFSSDLFTNLAFFAKNPDILLVTPVLMDCIHANGMFGGLSNVRTYDPTKTTELSPDRFLVRYFPEE